MKKIALLAVVVAVVVAFAAPVFADAGCEKAACKEASIFQKMADSMTLGPGKSQNKVIEFSGPKVTTSSNFQNTANGIQEGSAKARNMSLRTNISPKTK